MPKHKFSLKSGKTLEYKNGKWYYDGKLRSTKNFTLIDVDGYSKSLMPDGSLAVKDVDKKGTPIKPSYIGGTTKQARDKYWEQAPIMRHAVDSIANVYGISPKVLRNRLDKEGYTDEQIHHNNNTLGNTETDRETNRSYSNYSKLHERGGLYEGTSRYGLDDVFTYIEQGDVVPTPDTNYSDHYFINEHGRKTHAVSGETTKDNIDLTAATLKFMRDKAAKDFPNASRIFLDEAAGVYYNRGTTGGKKYMKSKKK